MAFKRTFNFESDADREEFFTGEFRKQMLGQYHSPLPSRTKADQAIRDAVLHVIERVTTEVAAVMRESNLHPSGFDKRIEEDMRTAMLSARKFVKDAELAMEKITGLDVEDG